MITHLRRLSKRPLAPVTVKRLLLVACVSIMASFWALPMYEPAKRAARGVGATANAWPTARQLAVRGCSHIYACTLVQAPAALGDISARLMATITVRGRHPAARRSRRPRH